MAVTALFTGTSLAAQSVDEQISALQLVSRDKVFNMLVTQYKGMFGKNNVTSDLKKRTITATINAEEDLGETTPFEIKKMFIEGLRGRSKDEVRLAKAVFARANCTMVIIFQGTDQFDITIRVTHRDF